MQRAIARGVSVYQGDIDQGLADYPDGAFDYVILSQTLQERSQAAEGVARDAARGPARDRRVSEFRTLDRAALASLVWPGASDEVVSARLVRFAQYSLPDSPRFRGARFKRALDRGTSYLSQWR